MKIKGFLFTRQRLKAKTGEVSQAKKISSKNKGDRRKTEGNLLLRETSLTKRGAKRQVRLSAEFYRKTTTDSQDWRLAGSTIFLEMK